MRTPSPAKRRGCADSQGSMSPTATQQVASDILSCTQKGLTSVGLQRHFRPDRSTNLVGVMTVVLDDACEFAECACEFELKRAPRTVDDGLIPSSSKHSPKPLPSPPWSPRPACSRGDTMSKFNRLVPLRVGMNRSAGEGGMPDSPTGDDAVSGENALA